jgi:hypothetical protein
MENKIKITNKEIVSETIYYNIDLIINNKKVNLTIWRSFDRDVGEGDLGFDYLSGSEDLTDEEEIKIEEFVNSGEWG